MDLIVLEIFPLTMHTTDSNIPSTDGATAAIERCTKNEKREKNVRD